MKFIKIPAFVIVLLLLMQIASKAFIAIDSSDIENIYGFYAEPKNSLDMVMIGPSEVYTGYAPALESSPFLCVNSFQLKCNYYLCSFPFEFFLNG